MKIDKARSTVGRISPNGLLEINRQRIQQALQLRTHRPCPTCNGVGRLASEEMVCLSLLRRIEARAATGSIQGARIGLHPELADALQNHYRRELADIESEFDIEIEIIATAGLHRPDEKIEWQKREKPVPPPKPKQAAITFQPWDLASLEDEEDDEDDSRRGRSRRGGPGRGGRRRRGRSGQAPPPPPRRPQAEEEGWRARRERQRRSSWRQRRQRRPRAVLRGSGGRASAERALPGAGPRRPRIRGGSPRRGVRRRRGRRRGGGFRGRDRGRRGRRRRNGGGRRSARDEEAAPAPAAAEVGSAVSDWRVGAALEGRIFRSLGFQPQVDRRSPTPAGPHLA